MFTYPGAKMSTVYGTEIGALPVFSRYTFTELLKSPAADCQGVDRMMEAWQNPPGGLGCFTETGVRSSLPGHDY